MSPGIVIVEFTIVVDIRKVFQLDASLQAAMLAVANVDLTPLQQKQKSAAWAKSKKPGAQGPAMRS